MTYPQYDTAVRALSGSPEMRRVVDVEEWRIEQAVDSGDVVMSIITRSGARQSFLLARPDAQDIGEVLRQKVGLPVDGAVNLDVQGNA